MKRSFIALMLVLLSAIVWMVWGGRSKLPPSQQMPDGTIVSIRKIYCAKSVTVPKGNKWQRMTAKVLPSIFAEKLGVGTTISVGSESILIFVESYRTNGFSHSRPGLPTGLKSTFETTGLVSDGVHEEMLFVRPIGKYFGNSSNTQIEVLSVPRVSRATTNLYLHLTQTEFFSTAMYGSIDRQNADFIVPNPTANSKSR